LRISSPSAETLTSPDSPKDCTLSEPNSVQPTSAVDVFREREVRSMAPTTDTVRFVHPKELTPLSELADLVPWYVRGKEDLRWLQIGNYLRAKS
jgi:hypothetical protein